MLRSLTKTANFMFIPHNFLLRCLCLSSIHEKANCITIFWTRRPPSLGSCHFRGFWATCLPHKSGGVPLTALPKVTTSELAAVISTTSLGCRAPSREAVDTIFKDLLIWLDEGIKPQVYRLRRRCFNHGTIALLVHISILSSYMSYQQIAN